MPEIEYCDVDDKLHAASANVCTRCYTWSLINGACWCLYEIVNHVWVSV